MRFPMAPGRPVFADTTVIIQHHFGTTAQRAAVTVALTGREVWSSTFVLFEYKRVLQLTCVELHRLLAKTGSIEETMRQFSQKFSRGQLSAGYLILADMGPFYPVEQFRERLERLIDRLLVQRFHASVDAITDETHCRLAYQEPVRQGCTYRSGFLSVARSTFDCDLPEFIEEHRTAFQKIYDFLSRQRSENTVGLWRLLDRVIRDPAKARGRNALLLGDAIIAVEMPVEAVLLTTNAADFEPICKALKKDLWVL